MPERLAYDEAMQFSALRLKVQNQELKEGKVEMVSVPTTQGLLARPWGIEGGFAVVYKFRRKNGTVCALRCFRVPMSPDTQFRYERIGPYFHAHAPDITAGFQYYDEAIVVKEQGKPANQRYPVIEMDWIEGVTLVDKINELCKKRHRAALKNLAAEWVNLLQIMERAHIAHGDLAGVNVMVRDDGKLVLIDYDGVYIPEFASLSQVLLGQDDFQHPQMVQRQFHEHMDAFSALVIYTALNALAVRPELWDSYAKFGSDGKLLDVNILFRKQDFQDPQQSPLFCELEQLGDAYLKIMVEELKRSCQRPINDVRFPFALIDPHYHEKQARASLESALLSKNIEQIAAVQPLLQYLKRLSDEERQCVEQAVAFVQAAHSSDDHAFLAAYDALQQGPYHSFFVFTQEQAERATQIRRQNEALERFRSALAGRSPWRLVRAYDPVLDNSVQITVLEREQLALARLLTEALLSGDDDQLLAADCALQQSPQGIFFSLTHEEKQYFALAQYRRAALLKLRMALKIGRPEEIVAAYSAVLENYQGFSQEEREQLAIARAFVVAFSVNSDQDIVDVDEAMQRSTAARYFVVTPQERQRIALARQRLQALEIFRQTIRSMPKSADRIVAAYDASLLDASTALTAEQREIVLAALRYLAMCKAVREGIRADSDDLIRSAYDPLLAQRFTDITAAEQQRIESAMLFQRLEDVLKKREYEQALLMAQTIERTRGEKISGDLTFRLNVATRRFIREHNLSDLSIEIEEGIETNYALVSWRWPATPLIQVALIVWQSGTWPDRPSEKSWGNPDWRHIWVRRKNNVLFDRERLPIGKGVHLYMRSYAAILDAWDQEEIWRFSDGDEPTSYAEVASPHTIWRIQ